MRCADGQACGKYQMGHCAAALGLSLMHQHHSSPWSRLELEHHVECLSVPPAPAREAFWREKEHSIKMEPRRVMIFSPAWLVWRHCHVMTFKEFSIIFALSEKTIIAANVLNETEVANGPFTQPYPNIATLRQPFRGRELKNNL